RRQIQAGAVIGQWGDRGRDQPRAVGPGKNRICHPVTVPPAAWSRRIVAGPRYGRVGRKAGGRRTCVACSNAYPSAIRVGSLNRPPKKETPIGSSPRTNPAGTVRFGY